MVQRRLRRFAAHEAAGESPLYEHLAAQAAEDTEVAGLLTVAPAELAMPTLLLAAAHRLVLAEPISELANYYPSVGGDRGVDPITWRTFRAFVLERADRMRELIARRATQTNEVQRAALLYPAVAQAAKEAGGQVGLLEVGCSAGLLLGIDVYGYRYALGEERITAGPPRAPLVLDCMLEVAPGVKRPPLPKRLKVAAKVGLDRTPVDLTDEESYAWLEACIWADHPERLRRLSLAAAVQRKHPPRFVVGDMVDDLTRAASEIPAALPLVVVTCSATCYLSSERRRDFVARLADVAASRPLWWVSQEDFRGGLEIVAPDRQDLQVTAADPLATLGLVRWRAGTAVVRALARTASHGDRMRWLGG